MAARNGLTYLRNVGKSLGYSAVDVFKEYNPGIAALSKSAKELSSELYESVKSFKSDFSSDRSEKNFVGTARSFVGELKENLMEDLQSGNWYNKARIDKNENEMFGLMFGMDGDDPFGDFDDFGFDDDFELEDSGDDEGWGEDTEAIVSAQKESTNTIVQAMDAAASKGAMAISTATVRSADYIVSANKESSKALYNMHQKGYNQISTGLAAINSNIASLLSLGEPITTHIQNSATFYTRSTEYQQKIVDLLEKIEKNTAVEEEKSSTNTRNIGMDDLISDGVLDLERYFSFLKDKVTSTTKEVGELTEMFGGVEGIKKLMTGSPAKFISDNIIKTLIPNMMKESMKSFNETFQNFFLAGMNKLQKKDFSNYGALGSLLESVKGTFLPREKYRSTPSTSNYQKGKIAWDGVSRKALTEVIPTQLAHIQAALTGGDLMIYDYDRGKFVSHGSLKQRLEDEKMNYARRAGGDFRDDLRTAVRGSSINNARKDEIMGQLDQFFLKTFEKGNGIYDVMSAGFDKDRYGIDDETLNLIRMMLKGYSKTKGANRALNFAGEQRSQRDAFGSYMDRLSKESNSALLSLFNGQEGFGNRKTAGGIVGVDEYNHDLFFYLQGIYQYTGHLSDNIGFIGGYGGKYNKRSEMKKGGKITPVRPIERYMSDQDRKNTNDKIKAEQEAASDRGYRFTEADILNALDPNHKRVKEKEKKYDLDGNEIEESDAEKIVNAFTDMAEKAGAKLDKRKKEQSKQPRMLNSLRDVLSIPANVVNDILESGERTMYRLIYGRDIDDEDEPGLFGYFYEKADELFDKFDKYQQEKGKKGIKAYLQEIKTKLFGEKDEDGNYTGGNLSSFANNVKENLRSAGEWAIGDAFDLLGVRRRNRQDNGVGSTEDINVNPPSARGRRVTKTGIVAVSEGELIIPSEYNPFYHGSNNKRMQFRNERRAMNRFFGQYRDGETVGGDDDNASRQDYINYWQNDVTYNADGSVNVGRTNRNNRIKKGANNLKDFVIIGLDQLINGGQDVLNRLFPQDSEEEENKIREALNSANAKTLKNEVKNNAGAMGAGALIGGGVSLLTGAIVGPLAGAAIGSAVALTIKSGKIQDILFGEEVEGENGKERKSGILPKKIANFMEKQIPGMAKGALYGGTAGMLFGSPVVGAIVGAGISYVKGSERAKTVLFGKRDKDGNEIEKGLIPASLQKKFKKAMPNISAGILAGALAGPFGIAGNLILGGALGYASSTEKFKELIFGKKNEEGKLEGGLLGDLRAKFLGDEKEGGLKEWFEEGFFNPIRGIFQKVGNELIIHSKNAWKRIQRKGRKALSKAWNSSLGRKIRNSKIGKAVGTVAGAAVGAAKLPFKALSGGLKSVDSALERRALRKGYGLYNNKEGRNMSAAERNEARSKYSNVRFALQGNKFAEFDEQLADMDDEQLAELQEQMALYEDPTKGYDEDLRKYGDEFGGSIDELFGQGKLDSKTGRKLLKYAKKGKSDKVSNILNQKDSNGNFIYDEETRNKLSGEYDKIKNTMDERAKTEADATEYRTNMEAKNPLFNLMGLGSMSKGQFSNALEYVNSEMSIRKDNKKGEEKKKEEHKNSPQGMHEEAMETTNNIKSKVDQIAEDIHTMRMGENEGEEKREDKEEKQKEEQEKKDEERTDKIQKMVDDAANEINTAITGSPDPNKRAIFNPDGTVSEFDTKGGTYTPANNESKNEMKDIISRTEIQNKAMEIIAGGNATGGIFSKIKDFFFGDEKQEFSIKNIFGSILSKGFKELCGPALLGGILTGFFNKAAKEATGGAIGEGSEADIQTSTVTDDDGNKVEVTKTVDEEGNEAWKDENGNEYDSADIGIIKVRSGDVSSLSERAWGNIARGTLTRKGHIGTLLAGKTTIGKTVKKATDKATETVTTKAISSIAKSDVIDKVYVAISNFCNALKKVPQLSKFADKLDDLAATLGDKIIAKLGSEAPEKLAKAAAKTAAMVAQVAFIVIDFSTGYQDARVTLGIQEPTKSQKILSGLIRAAKNCIPFVGSIIPDSLIVDVFCDFLAPIFHIDISDLKKQQDTAQAELEQWNEEHPDQACSSWEEYQKKVLGNYTWTEKIGNVAKSAGATAVNAVKNIKNNLVSSKASRKLKNGINNVKDKVKGKIDDVKALVEEKGVDGALIEGLKQTPMGKLTDSLVGKVKKAIENIQAVYAETEEILKGDGDLGSDLKSFFDFSKYTDEGDNPLNGVEKGIMFTTRLVSVPTLIFRGIGKKIKGFVVNTVDKVKSGATAVGTEFVSIRNIAKTGDIGGMWSADLTVDEDSPVSGVMKAVSFSSKLINTPTALFHFVGNKVKDFISSQVEKIRTGVKTVATEFENVKSIAKTGDIGGMWSADLTVDEDSPVSGVMKAVSFSSKLINTPTALFHFVGNKVKDFFKRKIDGVKSDYSLLQETHTKMKDLADQGKPGEIWGISMDTSKEDPLAGIFKGVGALQKMFYVVVGFIKDKIGDIADMASRPVEWLKEKLGDKVEGVKDKVVETASNVKEKVGDTVNGIGNWINEKYKNFKGTIFGGSSGIVNDETFVSQLDTKYKDMPYSNSTVGEIGCAPAAATMLINQQKPGSITMDQALKTAQKYQTTNGTTADYFGDILGQSGIGAEYVDGTGSGKQKLIDNLKAGKPTILLGQDPSNISKDKSPFGGNKHFVVAKYMDERGNVVIDDPESSQPNKTYSSNILKNVSLGISTPSNMDGIPGKGSDESGGEVTLDNEINRAVWGFFTGKGYSPAATAGIMGNLFAESGIDPTRLQNGGPAGGIAQWESFRDKDGRWKGLSDYAASKGKDWTDLESQLEYIDAELKNDGSINAWIEPTTANQLKNKYGGIESFKSSDDISNTTLTFFKAFERGNPDKAHMDTRMGTAKDIYNLFNDSPYTGNFDPTIGSAAMGSSSMGLATNSNVTGDGVSGSTATNGGKLGVAAVLSAINSAFSNFFSGNQTDEGSIGTGASNAVMNTGLNAIGATPGIEGFTPTPGGPGTSKQKQLVETINSVVGKLQYSMKGARDPEKGSADCSSTVNWAYKKVFGKDIGNDTASILNSPETEVVDLAQSGMDPNAGGSNSSGPNVENLEPGDLLLYSRPTSDYSAGRPYRVGHVEMYAGDGMRIGHGSGIGPKVTEITKNANQYIMAKRLKDVASYGAGSGLLKKLSKYTGGDSGIEQTTETPGLIGAVQSQLPSLTPLKLFGGTEAAATSSPVANSGSGNVLQALQTLIGYVQSIASNTASIGAISSTLTNYCGAKVANDVEAVDTAKAATATAAATTAAAGAEEDKVDPQDDPALEDLMDTLNLIATG